jgi:hypothetical protein
MSLFVDANGRHLVTATLTIAPCVQDPAPCKPRLIHRRTVGPATPNAHLGIALSLLFVARIIFRAVQVYVIDPSVPHDPSDFARTPLTLAVFGVLAGYYIAYAIGLARWRAGVMSTH